MKKNMRRYEKRNINSIEPDEFFAMYLEDFFPEEDASIKILEYRTYKIMFENSGFYLELHIEEYPDHNDVSYEIKREGENFNFSRVAQFMATEKFDELVQKLEDTDFIEGKIYEYLEKYEKYLKKN
ncbi:MAG: hypothetical protein MSH33_01735 [Fusobacterium necrophorum]|nr:hypothetical protein [Fusobacterium necrophorum]